MVKRTQECVMNYAKVVEVVTVAELFRYCHDVADQLKGGGRRFNV